MFSQAKKGHGIPILKNDRFKHPTKRPGVPTPGIIITISFYNTTEEQPKAVEPIELTFDVQLGNENNKEVENRPAAVFKSNTY